MRIEMKHCTEQVEKLTKEFFEMKEEIKRELEAAHREEFFEIKRELEAARKEVDTTRCALNEVTMKLLSTTK